MEQLCSHPFTNQTISFSQSLNHIAIYTNIHTKKWQVIDLTFLRDRVRLTDIDFRALSLTFERVRHESISIKSKEMTV